MVTQRPARPGARFSRRGWMILICAAAVAGCAGPPPAPKPEAGVQPRPAVAAPTGARRYEVDAGHSQVTIRVYRAGRLARLGHNHVISSTVESGIAWSNGSLQGSGFEVRLPVATLVVDDPSQRLEAGPDFPGELPDAAREGTRRNMLRPEVLDGERYPEIVVRAQSLTGTWESPTAIIQVVLKDQARTIELPLEIRREPDALLAHGTFRIRQSDFGITPFSVAGGALQVADEVDVSFEIRAVVRDGVRR